MADSSSAIALSLCYAAKIRWLTLGEEKITQNTFKNVYKMTIENWPEIPPVEMYASLFEEPSVYIVDLRFDPKGAGWFVTNDIPVTIQHRGDIVTHYFFLLRKVIERIPDSKKKVLGEALQAFSEDLFAPGSESPGLKGLGFLNSKANLLIKSYTQ